MENQTQQVAAAPAAPAKAKRGLGSARGTQRLRFSHEHAEKNGLFYAHLESIVVSEIEISDQSTGMPSFNGCKIPRIAITFVGNKEPRYVTLQFNAVESNVKTIPGGEEEWKVSAVFDWMKHLLNVYYLKGRELTPEEEDILSLSYDDTDENGDYNPVAAEDVIAGWKALFENFAAIMNTAADGAPVYKTKDGKIIPVWIKLVRYMKSKKNGWKAVSNGDLAFPTFVGEGCIELYRQGQNPCIRLDAIRETILPQKEEAKKPTVPGVSVPSMPGAVPVIDPMMGGYVDPGLATEAGEDNPF